MAALALLVVVLAIYRGGVGASEVKGLSKDDEKWLSTFLRTSGAGIALSMFGLFFWVALFLLTSTGLQFYGL